MKPVPNYEVTVMVANAWSIMNVHIGIDTKFGDNIQS